MNLDIHTGVQTALVLSLVAILFSVLVGVRSIIGASQLKFFRMRRERQLSGWRLIGLAVVLGLVALKDAKTKFVEKKEEKITEVIRRRKGWSFLKGFLMVLVNPLGIVSWMICLQFLRKNGVFIPMTLNYEIAFFLVVIAGAGTYFFLIIFITNKMKGFFNPDRTSKVVRGLGYILISFSIYFLFYAVKAFFFNHAA